MCNYTATFCNDNKNSTAYYIYTQCISTILITYLAINIRNLQQRDTPAVLHRDHLQQESRAIAKKTARCALYMDALKNLGSPWLCPRLLFPKLF